MFLKSVARFKFIFKNLETVTSVTDIILALWGELVLIQLMGHRMEAFPAEIKGQIEQNLIQWNWADNESWGLWWPIWIKQGASLPASNTDSLIPEKDSFALALHPDPLVTLDLTVWIKGTVWAASTAQHEWSITGGILTHSSDSADKLWLDGRNFSMKGNCQVFWGQYVQLYLISLQHWGRGHDCVPVVCGCQQIPRD